jgi:uncharacterized repeat protein (TIGR03803 family)
MRCRHRLGDFKLRNRFGLVCLLCVAATISFAAVTFITLVNFTQTTGVQPYYVSLVQGRDGNLYGTTNGGGAHLRGTIFKMPPSGKTRTTLVNFDGTNGAFPYAGLVLSTDGNFYGTTCCAGIRGRGTIFKVTPSGMLTVLYVFTCSTDGNCPQGFHPDAALVQGNDGNFYGTTHNGGAYGDYGTVFRITQSGALTTLHTFRSGDGANPYAALVQGNDGKFYGTTHNGGAYGDYGTIFRITSSGAFTTLHSFQGSDGANPYAALTQASDRNFYGTTSAYGVNGCGTVFKITPGGVFTTLHNFHYFDGAHPYAPVVQATDGNFYGTTFSGGASDIGTAFRITTAGIVTVLHSFQGTDGSRPEGGLVQYTSGSFYGVTRNQGSGGINAGTVFRVGVGLGPFVKTVPTSGTVGSPVTILGNALTGATQVTFNGIAAKFRIVSGSDIETTVPLNATTGLLHVIRPNGTLSSSVNFRVTPSI